MAALDLLGRRWALRILWELKEGAPPTFRELQQRCGGVSSSVLATRLRELEEAGIVGRDDRGYGLTETGSDLVRALTPLTAWAARWGADG